MAGCKAGSGVIESPPMDHEELAARLSVLLSQLHRQAIVHDAFRTLDRGEGPLLRIDAQGYHLLWRERGQDTVTFSTENADALLYRIIADSAFSAGCAYEFENRIEGPDFRRMVHAKQRELFERLGTRWRARLEAELASTLAEHPYTDGKAG